MLMFAVETTYSKELEPGLQFVGQSEEIDMLNQRLVPLVLANLAIERITDYAASALLEHIGHWGTVSYIPNRNKAAALTILDESWRDNLGERLWPVMEQGVKGFLTSRQVSEEVAFIGRLAGQPDLITWLTSDGYEARNSESALHVQTYAKPDSNAEGEEEKEVEESPWTAELGPNDLELAQRTGATHIARKYQVTFTNTPGERYPLPIVNNPRLRLGIENEEGFLALGTV